MKKPFLLFIILLTTLTSVCQDTVRIVHKNYTTVFSKSKRYPVLVEWWVTREKIKCEKPLKRKDKFATDPKLPKETDLLDDYVGSGFDRGHMCPAADNLCQTQEIQDECFYFSNMSPQYHSLNAGDWKSLETFTRESLNKGDSIYVWCGNIGDLKKIKNVTVPTKCWKVIYFKSQNVKLAYLFDNSNYKPDGFENNQVDIKVIEKLTGYKFN